MKTYTTAEQWDNEIKDIKLYDTSYPYADVSGEIKYYDFQHRYHRTDGPAIESKNLYEGWYFHGKLHRIGGPAWERIGVKSWWIDGKQISKEYHDLLVDIIKLKELI